MKLEDLYQQYAIQTPQQDSTLLRQLMQARQPFSGAKQPERSTMSIASPYDTRAAEIARTTLPKIANDVAMLGANFAPGSGEYLSAQQSAEDTAKAREAFAKGNYGEAAASGANALVNAVGSLPIAHQAIAAGKGAVGLAKGLLGGEHMLMAGAPFFSKLENVVASKMGGKSNIDDLIRMAKNNGVSDAEINSTIRGLEGTVTKQQALDTVRAKQPEFKDVLLGNGRNNLDALQRERQAIQDSILHGEVAPDTQAAKDKVKEINNRYMSGDLSLNGEKYYKLRNEAESEMERLFQRDYGDKYKRMDEIDRQIKNAYTDDTHFSEYTTPGAKEESYREMFVTAPEPHKYQITIEKISNGDWEAFADGDFIGIIDKSKTYEQAVARAKEKATSKIGYRYDWNDGHSQYSDIQNPIVRIRFNDRDVDGKNILFVEEMQGPSAANQEKMPEELRNRIYDIGTKRVLNYAKENGYDGVAWTKGDMQAQRYDLSKHVDNIDVNPKGGNREVSIYFKNDTDGYLQLDVDASGIVTATANKRGEPFVGKPIQEVVGKEVGGKIIQTVKRENLSGLDLQVGGEGLKSLYDKTLPSMFKKYGKEPVSTIELNPTKTTWGINGSSGMRFDDLEEAMMHARNVGSEVVPYETLNDAHYIPITDKTPDSFPQYGDGGLVTPEEQLNTMVFQPSDIDAYSEPIAPSQPDDTLEQLIRSRNEAEAAYVPPAAEEAPVQQATKPVQRKQVAKPLDIRAMVTAAADKFKVPRWMAHGVASNESGYDTKAKSRVGATSVMQLMPATAKSLGVTNINDPRQNINAGVKYLRDLLNKYKGDYRLALAAYNAGPTNVAKYNGVPPFAETQAYVNKVLKHRNYKYGDGGSVDLDDNADFGGDDGYTPYDESEVSSLIDLVLHGDNGDIDQATYEPLYKDEEDNQVNGREWRTPNISEGMPSLPSARIMKGALKLGDVNLGVNAQGRSRSGAENYRQQAFDVTLPVGQGSLQLGTSRYSDPYSSDTGKRAAYNTYLGSSQHSPSLNMMLEKYKSQKHPNFGVELSFPFGKGGKVSSDDILNKIEKLIRKGQYAVADMIGVKPETKFATEVSERYFPNEEHNERADAMRHMLFQAQLYKRSPLLSNAVGWAHENTALTQPDEEREMDEYNDVLGRGIAITSDDEPQTLVRKALEAIQSGKAKYMTPEENARLRRESAYADGGQVKSLQQMYEDAMLLTQPDYNSKMNEFMATKAPPFSGGRKFDSSTMGIATPQDVQFAEDTKENVLPIAQHIYESTIADPTERLASWYALIDPDVPERLKTLARDYVAPSLVTKEGTINEEGLSRAATPMLSFVSPMAMKKLKGAWGEASKSMAEGATWDEVKGAFNKQLEREFKSGEIGTNKKPLQTTSEEYIPTGELNAIGEPVYQRMPTEVKSETGRYTPSDYMDSLVSDPWFNGMNVFDKVRVFSEVERAYTPTRSKTYSDTQSLSQNKKLAGSNIVAVDTIRGCENNCPSCFANAGGSQGNIVHTALVPQQWKGKLDPKNILRVGEVGDPATDWSYSNGLVTDAINNSSGTSFDKNLFGITKLQNIDNFDPSIWRNLEVSLDPLMPDHMATTMNNIKAIKDADPTVNIVVRIRSLKSKNPELMAEQQKAVDFAKDMGLEILETKLRFKNKNYLKALDLDPEAYSTKGAQVVYKKDSILKDVGNKDADITLCGEGDIKGRCLACRGCERLGSKTLPKEWKGSAEYYENQLDKGNISLKDYEEAMQSIHNKARGGFVNFAEGGSVRRPATLQEYYEKYNPPTYDDTDNIRALMSAKPEPFSGARQPERSTMGISSPYDNATADIARKTLPELANNIGMLIAGFTPGSGEYLSAKQSYDATDKAQKAIGEGNYAEAAAQGIDAVINAVGSIPIAHQIMALGKGAVGVAKGLMGAEHLIPAITTYHGSPTSGIRKWDLNFRGTGEGGLKAGDVGQDSFRDMIGHGLYSAEREGIAKGYQERLAKNNLKDLSEAFSQSFPGGEAIIDRIHYPNAKSLSEAVEKGYVDASKLPIPFRNALSKGSLYTTELTPHPDEFLLWDKPLSEQSEKVKAALESTLQPLQDEFNRAASMVKGAKPSDITDFTGRYLYERFLNKGSDKAASEYLHSLGIRGIKYLDSSSRNVDFDFKVTATKNGKVIGEKFAKTEEEANRIAQSYKGGISGVTTSIDPAHTYNYVMFNPAEEAIITHENGQRIPGAVEEAYRKLRDPKSKAILLERYPELKDLDKPLVNSQDNRIQKVKPWSTPQQEVSSASTSISYPDVEAKSPVIFKAFKNGKINVGPINADIGGGRYDQITNWLQKQGVQNVVYDPFNRTMEHNQSAMEQLAGGKADTATVSNVLNVIPDAENRAITIATAYDAIRPGGKAYFSMYAAPKVGEVKGRDAYQVGKKPSEYIPEIEAIFGEGAVHRQGDLIIATKRGESGIKTPLAQKKTKGYANGGMVKEYNPKEIDEIANMVREGIYG